MKKLGFGFMRLPVLNQEDRTSIDYLLLNKMVDVFMDNGFTYFDTAYPYHNGYSEIAIGKCVSARYPRESFFLTDKITMNLIDKVEDHEKIFKEQLRKCQVEYFDNYLVHNMGEISYHKAKKMKTFEWVKNLKDTGRVKAIGFSFHDSPELLEEILRDNPFVDYVQLQLNYIDWDSHSIKAKSCYEIATKYGKKILVMEPVKGGTLAEVPTNAKELFENFNSSLSVTSWAIRFAASLKNVSCVLSGMTTLEQVLDNTSYMAEFTPMNNDEYRIINEVIEVINESIAIPCTACEYCVKGCPMNILIPKYFSLYNIDIQYKDNYFSPQSVFYKNSIETNGKASDCINCGQCEKTCPQHIEITKWLKEVANRFE